MAAPVPQSSPEAIEAYKRYQEQLAAESPEIKAARQIYNELGYERNRAEAEYKAAPTEAKEERVKELQAQVEKALEDLLRLLKLAKPDKVSAEKGAKVAKAHKPSKPHKPSPKEVTDIPKLEEFILEKFPLHEYASEVLRNLDRYEKKTHFSGTIIMRRFDLKRFDEKLIQKFQEELKKFENQQNSKRLDSLELLQSIKPEKS